MRPAPTIAERPARNARGLTRRELLLAGAALPFTVMSVARGEPGHGAEIQSPASSRPGVLASQELDEVAPGLFFRPGIDEEATAANLGAIANVGFIVGRSAVAVFDPGGSFADGEHLRALIRKVTQLPIRHVVLSHGHPDHLFGAAAFESDRPQFIGHARLPGFLAQRGEYSRKRLAAALGSGQAAGKVVMPTVTVKDRLEIDLGGRILEIIAHPTAHTDTDLTAMDRQSGTLLASDLLFIRRIPALDGSLRGWLSVLASLKALPARRAVPGHGVRSGSTGVDWPQAAADLERYLGVLLRETREALAKGLAIEEAVNVVGQSEKPRWALFDDYHGRNVTQAFKELEWE